MGPLRQMGFLAAAALAVAGCSRDRGQGTLAYLKAEGAVMSEFEAGNKAEPVIPGPENAEPVRYSKELVLYYSRFLVRLDAQKNALAAVRERMEAEDSGAADPGAVRWAAAKENRLATAQEAIAQLSLVFNSQRAFLMRELHADFFDRFCVPAEEHAVAAEAADPNAYWDGAAWEGIDALANAGGRDPDESRQIRDRIAAFQQAQAAARAALSKKYSRQD